MKHGVHGWDALCACGNRKNFSLCTVSGKVVEQEDDWTGRYMRCSKCGKVVDVLAISKRGLAAAYGGAAKEYRYLIFHPGAVVVPPESSKERR